MKTPEQRTERYFTVVYKLTDANVAKYLSNRDWITYVYADSMAELANLKELSAEPAATQPAWLDLPAGVEAVGEMRASESLGVAPYADIWGWLQPGTKLYSATQVQAMLSHRIAPGCQAVRVEPTKEMVIEAYKAQGEATSSACEEIYRAMLAAAPSGPARQPLTDAEVSSVYFEVLGTVRIQDPTLINRLVRATEAAHGIAAQKGDAA